MQELIKVNYENNNPTVSARELHEFLEVKDHYTDWFKRMTEYGFVENTDYMGFSEKSDKPQGGRPTINHQLTIEMAKELCMIQRNEKGKQARTYFINLEKAWNTPSMIMARALQIAKVELDSTKQENIQLSEKIKQDKPKVIFANAVTTSKTSILIGELAKLLKQNGIDIGQNRLFEWLRGNGYLIKRKGTDYNMPTQKSMELELFEIKETSINHSDGHISVNKTSKVTGKGQEYFVNKFLDKNKAS